MQFITDFLTSSVSTLNVTILIRLVTATLLGAAIGYEREKAGKIAGLRTHTLVALGSALFTVVSILLFLQYPSINGTIGYDYHLIANIIVGIGFIGAGAILRNGDHVVGTTTAATLWVAAAIGMSSGLGYYVESVATTVLAYAVLTGLWYVEKRMHRNGHPTKPQPFDTNGSSESRA